MFQKPKGRKHDKDPLSDTISKDSWLTRCDLCKYPAGHAGLRGFSQPDKRKLWN